MRIGRAPLEVERLIPGARLIVFGMDQKRSNAGNVRRLAGAEQRILEQRLAKAAPLVAPVDRQPGKKHDWDWMACESFADAAWRRRVFDRAYGEAVIADDPPLAETNHIGLSATGLLADERMAL